jgi:LacI family transcriptional regulator
MKLHAPKIKYKQLPSDALMPLELDRRISEWLINLPKPVGIFATTDHVAAFVLELCHQVSIRVPEDVCVIGVDNDQLVSGFARPPLSSIALPSRKIGFESARLLEQLMDGKRPTTSNILFQPHGIVTRQSTDLLMVQDEDVQTAVRYIRENVHEKISVSDVLDAVPMNRRYLERKFMQLLGRTPLQEIRRVRIDRARDLLQSTDLPMANIAKRCGFANAQRLAETFRQVTGITPSAFRHANRNDELI